MDQVLYHATRSDWVEFVLTNGLKPNGPDNAPQRILLFLDEQDARALAATVFGVTPNDACILAVNPLEVKLATAEAQDGPIGRHVFAVNDIPPRALALCDNS